MIFKYLIFSSHNLLFIKEIRNLIEVSSLSKSFKKSHIKALSNISFSVKKGEASALLGENGAGKTTLIRIISTILKPDSGTCRIKNFCSVNNPEQVRKNIGLLQGGEAGLYDRLTAYENIEYFGLLHKIDRETIKKKNIHVFGNT